VTTGQLLLNKMRMKLNAEKQNKTKQNNLRRTCPYVHWSDALTLKAGAKPCNKVLVTGIIAD